MPQPADPDLAMAIFGADIPFADHCGIEEVGLFEGRTRLRLAVAPCHANNFGIAHGGVICTLLDVALGTVARITIGRPVMTLDLQVTFLSPGRGILIGEGKVVRAGRSILFCEAEARTEDGDELVARATGLFKPLRATAQKSV